MAEQLIRLDLVRHGEVATPGLLCAPSDEPLSEAGQAQLTGLLAVDDWELIISSPSRRCSEFAEHLAQDKSIPLRIDSAWREINLGEWTGKKTELIWREQGPQLLQLWQDPMAFEAPGGEKMTDFIARIRQAWQRLLELHAGSNILLLTHAGAIRALLGQLLGLDPLQVQKFRVEHGRINRLCIYPDGEISVHCWGCSPAELT